MQNNNELQREADEAVRVLEEGGITSSDWP